MATTFIQRKKRQRRIFVIFGFVILSIVAVLFLGNRDDSIPTEVNFLLEPSESTTQAAQVLISDISIPQDFFEDGVLERFSSYEPIGVPQIKGRINPFAPLVQPVVEQEGAFEEGEES